MPKMPEYKAEDRSILLPYYKRFLVHPTLPFIPARVHPNSITHTGHILCLLSAILLLATRPERGFLFLVSMALVQIYCWCDNADGSHARRTKQSSATGEFLDHGLDVLNTVYISVLTVLTMGTSGTWTVAMVMLIPAASALTFWEQSCTGVFRAGLLNQIESITVLTGAMIATTFFGTGWWRTVGVGPLSLFAIMLGWPAITITFGKVRALIRVAREGKNIAPALVYIALQWSVVLAAHLGYLSVLVACSFVTVANVYFGIRNLVLRVRGELPGVDPILVAALVGSVALLGWRSAGLPLNELVGMGGAVAICAFFAGLVALHTRQGIQILERVEASR